MKKKKIVKTVFGFLRKNGFWLRKNSGVFSTTYLFTNRDDMLQKIIISDTYDQYLDIKVRGKDAKILLNYEWDMLDVVDELDDVDNMVASVRKVYQAINKRRMNIREFKDIVNTYSETIKKNLDLILKK